MLGPICIKSLIANDTFKYLMKFVIDIGSSPSSTRCHGDFFNQTTILYFVNANIYSSTWKDALTTSTAVTDMNTHWTYYIWYFFYCLCFKKKCIRYFKHCHRGKSLFILRIRRKWTRIIGKWIHFKYLHQKVVSYWKHKPLANHCSWIKFCFEFLTLTPQFYSYEMPACSSIWIKQTIPFSSR